LGVPYYGAGYGYAPNYYNGPPSYAVDPGVNYAQPQSSPYYGNPAMAQQTANMTVLLPAPNAQVWFDNTPTSQQGVERVFHSPSLAPNQNFTYTIRAHWMENGQPVDQERQVVVQAGKNVTVNFR
jgi:uncharacterized protein (TIGR03000 family)